MHERNLMNPGRVLVLALLLGAPAPAQVQALAPETRPPSLLLVSGWSSNTVHLFSGSTGSPRGDLGWVPGAQSICLGPDGLLYVSVEKTDRIARLDGRSLAFVDFFVVDDPQTPQDETGGLDGPTGAVFGPSGDLYVASFDSDEVLRYDGATGAFAGVFVSAGAGGLNGPDAGISFGPGGDLFVPSFYSDEVLRFDGVSGVSLGAFAAKGAGGLARPRDLEFHHDGLVYVSSWGSNSILRFDRQGNFVDLFATSNTPTGIAFGPHNGDLYVASDNKNFVRRFDRASGAFVEKLVSNGAGGLAGATFLHFVR